MWLCTGLPCTQCVRYRAACTHCVQGRQKHLLAFRCFVVYPTQTPRFVLFPDKSTRLLVPSAWCVTYPEPRPPPLPGTLHYVIQCTSHSGVTVHQQFVAYSVWRILCCLGFRVGYLCRLGLRVGFPYRLGFRL